MTKLMSMTMARKGGALYPTSPLFLEDLEKIKEGEQLVVTLNRSRNADQLKLFWALVAELVDAIGWEGDRESLKKCICIRIGHVTYELGAPSFSVETTERAERVVRECNDPDSDRDDVFFAKAILKAGPTLHVYPKSIAFESCPQEEFNDFFRRFGNWAATEYGIDIEELIRRAEMRSGTKWEREKKGKSNDKSSGARAAQDGPARERSSASAPMADQVGVADPGMDNPPASTHLVAQSASRSQKPQDDPDLLLDYHFRLGDLEQADLVDEEPTPHFRDLAFIKMADKVARLHLARLQPYSAITSEDIDDEVDHMIEGQRAAAA